MRHEIERKKIIIIAAIAAVFFAVIIYGRGMLMTAYGHTDKTKTVTSVLIEEGDSLWSIASEYYSRECGDMKDYVDEIRDANHIFGDTINAGNYIIVPFYR